MCNEATKILIALSILLPACTGDNNEKQAEALVAEAQTALDCGDFEQAIVLTDSVKNSCPRAIEQRKEALYIAVRANEGLSVRRLAQSDSLLVALAARADSLKGLVKFVSNPVEGYYVAAGANPAATYSQTGVQPRLSPEGDFYLISTLKGRNLGSTSITLSSAAGSASTSEVAFDGERNDRSQGGEVITFIAAECDSVGKFVFNNPAVTYSLTFNGKGTYTTSLSPSTVRDIATLYDYSLTLRRAKVANLEKQRLTRAVEIARSQAARTYVEETPDK